MSDPTEVGLSGMTPAVEAALLGRGLGLTILEATHALIVVLDRRGVIVAFNRACERATGWSASEVVGSQVWDKLLTAEEAPEVRGVFESLAAGDYPNQHENDWVARDGSLRLIAWSNTALLDEGGDVEYVVGTGIDITSHGRVERELNEAVRALEARTAEMSELMTAAHAMQDVQRFEVGARTIFDAARRATGAAAGYVALLSDDGSENEVLFLEAGEIPCRVDPTLPMPIRGLREIAYRTGAPAWENDFAGSEWVGFMPEGHAPLDNVLFAPLVVDGSTVGIIGLANKPGGFTPDDARMASGFGEMAAAALSNAHTVERLTAGERRFRSVAESAADAIVCIDAQGSITYWNTAASSIFGWSVDEAIGMSVECIMPERHRGGHADGVARFLDTREPRLIGGTVEIEGLRADGSEFPVELSLGTWESREGTSFTAVLRDITERKQTEKSLAKMYEMEHRIAETLQASLLSATDAMKGLVIGAVYVPASEAVAVGGDFYDAFELDDGRVAILVGDVAGKGVGAAALTLSVRSAVRALAHADACPAPSAILRLVGGTLMRQLPEGAFVTASLAFIDPATGEFEIASAGHPAPLVVGERVLALDVVAGPPLGIMEWDYPEHRFAIGEDEYLLLYTDGLSEARSNGRQFGEEGIVAAATELLQSTPQEIAEHLLDAARRYAKGTLQDDVAILVARRERGGRDGERGVSSLS